MNLPLPAGCGHAAYLYAMDKIVLPAIAKFNPDMIVVACGYDAAIIDPLARMQATAETFRAMTEQVKAAARDLCDGKLVLAHEGGYSEVYVPFCGHATLEALSGSATAAPFPYEAGFAARQPNAKFQAFLEATIDDLALYHQERL